MVTLLVVAAALTVSFASEKQYDGSAELLFGGQEQVDRFTDPSGGGGQQRDPERELNTAVELISNETVTAAVRKELRLDIPIDELTDKVETEAASSSDLVTITARDPDRRRAAAIANAFARQFVDFRRSAARTRFEEAADTVDARAGRARLNDLRTAAALQTGGVEIVRLARPYADR
jgi:capsular polysaccharide biosynthesis protein